MLPSRPPSPPLLPVSVSVVLVTAGDSEVTGVPPGGRAGWVDETGASGFPASAVAVGFARSVLTFDSRGSRAPALPLRPLVLPAAVPAALVVQSRSFGPSSSEPDDSTVE